ncbi:zinc finger protein 395b isoform X2 [Clupea harengus]|uniref:Zinc finger protein 395b isoform X2 n=1 Tax=Clupea harengus TaxID=7950 RepID=A0A6P8GJ60_CLUHA|nr:zinc finger protein 395b isoform X2 [Clupea harengus]
MAAVQPRGRLSPADTRPARGPEDDEGLIYMQCCGQEDVELRDSQRGASVYLPAGSSEGAWPSAAPLTCAGSSNSFRSPESVEMDEIMAAMVLTSLSCSPRVHSPPQKDLLPASSSSGDMECGGGELSDSGSSGYWSWDHGSASPAPSPSVTEMDGSLGQPPDEGLHMELDYEARRYKGSGKGAYRCLWPSCGKVLNSRVGMKRHIQLHHLGGGSEHSQREEDFYYAEISSEEEPAPPSPAPTLSIGPWASCSSPLGASTPGTLASASAFSTPLSQSAPSSVWQIHTEHLYQVLASRSRSVSVGEQWLQRNSAPTRSQTISASPSRNHCTFRKGRGEAKKCRKVYGVERRDQWCTACRWKKACQRFPD